MSPRKKIRGAAARPVIDEETSDEEEILGEEEELNSSGGGAAAEGETEENIEMEDDEDGNNLSSSLKRLFQTTNLYKVLGLIKDEKEKKNFTDAQIRKAYYKQSLKYHPDRVQNDGGSPGIMKESTEKFQALGAAYKILSDPEKKKLYDETGVIRDSDTDSSSVKDWDSYWRNLFKKVTVADIKEFEKKYKNSEEEMEDLKKAYLEGEGSMDYILDHVLCSVQEEDEERFSKILSDWIEEETIPAFKNFTHETKKSKKNREKKAKSEAKEAESAAKELGLGGKEEDLVKMIQQRQAKREQDSNNFLDALAAKYAKPSAKTGGSKRKK